MNIWKRISLLEKSAETGRYKSQLLRRYAEVQRSQQVQIDNLTQLHNQLVDTLGMVRDDRRISRYVRKGGPEIAP